MYLFRSLEMPLINCKIHLELNWNNNCVMYRADVNTDGNDRETTLKTTSTKLYVPIVTLSSKDNLNLTKQLHEGFKRSVYSNEYKFPLDASFQGTNGLFALAFNKTTDNDNEVLASKTANRVQRDSHRK